MASKSFNECIETIRDMAVEGAQTAVRKTKQLAAVAKANLDIRAEEEKIRKAQIELGKLYYKDYIVGEEPDPAEYTPWCEKISESKIAIEDLKITIENLRGGDAEDVPAADDEAPAEAEDAEAEEAPAFDVEVVVEKAPEDAPDADSEDKE